MKITCQIKQQFIKLFETPEANATVSVKMYPILLWVVLSSTIGGAAAFLYSSTHGLLMTLSVMVAVLAITAKPFVKWSMKK